MVTVTCNLHLAAVALIFVNILDSQNYVVGLAFYGIVTVGVYYRIDHLSTGSQYARLWVDSVN